MQPGLAAQPVLWWLVGFSKTDGSRGGVSWPTGMRNQSSYLRPELRRTWSLHPGPRDLPEHLLCQASRDGPSQALGTGSERKTPLFTEPSSPSCARLSPHSHQLRPTERLGTSKPLRPGGLTLTDAGGMAKLVAEAHAALKCLHVPRQWHRGGSPQASWEVALPGTEMPRSETPVQLAQLLWCWRCSRAPLLGGHPGERDLPKGSLAELALSAFPHYSLLPLCSSHSPTSVGTSLPCLAPQAQQQSQPASHPLCLWDALEVGVVSESSSLMRKS